MPSTASTGSAVFDESGRYRYLLTRVWDPSKSPVTWVMLNPSTATDVGDDQTIRRVVGLSRSWGRGSAVVVNLFALMAKHPEQVSASPDPVGPENDIAIECAVDGAGLVVLAWGNHGSITNPVTGSARDEEVMAMLDGCGQRLMCLDRTRDGQPRHPLYLRRDVIPEPF